MTIEGAFFAELQLATPLVHLGLQHFCHSNPKTHRFFFRLKNYQTLKENWMKKVFLVLAASVQYLLQICLQRNKLQTLRCIVQHLLTRVIIARQVSMKIAPRHRTFNAPIVTFIIGSLSKDDVHDS